MKYIIGLISAVNLYLGLWCFLNVIHVLQSSKYAQGATAVFALLFLAFGAAGFYFTYRHRNIKLGMLVSIGPWVLSVVILLFVMLTSSYQ